jgi:hypothetical protein
MCLTSNVHRAVVYLRVVCTYMYVDSEIYMALLPNISSTAHIYICTDNTASPSCERALGYFLCNLMTLTHTFKFLDKQEGQPSIRKSKG